MMNKKIDTAEIFYFDDCPSWENAGIVLEDAMENLGISQEIVYTRVESEEEAVEKKFTGSPMITINGKNLFPPDHSIFALGCRVYPTPAGLKGYPTKEMMLKNLKLALGLNI